MEQIKAQIKAQRQQHYQENKEELNRKSKEYYHKNKEKVKARNEAKKQEKSDYFKDYYQANKERLLEKSKRNKKHIRIKCECGRDVDNYNLSRHLKTQLHCKLVADKQNEEKRQMDNINELRKKHFKW